jgi:hypothetical protein
MRPVSEGDTTDGVQVDGKGHVVCVREPQATTQFTFLSQML